MKRTNVKEIQQGNLLGKLAPLLGFHLHCLPCPILDRVHPQPSPAEQFCMGQADKENPSGGSEDREGIVRDDYKEKKVKVDRLIDILKMMEDVNFPLLHLLEVICEKSLPHR